MKKMISTILVAASLMVSAANVGATPYVVDANVNSSSGGAGLSTIALTAGESFTVTVNPNDLWNAGSLPRWSNADGLTGNLYATGTDESGQAAGTQIGQNFGLYAQNGLSAPYGTLVGQLGSTYFKIGTSYSGIAAVSDTLKLYYWDTNNYDNTQSITANVSAVPEPGTMLLLGVGMFGVVVCAKRRKVSKS